MAVLLHALAFVLWCVALFFAMVAGGFREARRLTAGRQGLAFSAVLALMAFTLQVIA